MMENTGETRRGINCKREGRV